jgi:putative phosphoesterase
MDLKVYRIGVIADTHIPEFLPALPEGVAQVFQGVDMILHAGDITGTEVLEDLRKIAPVIAIKGDHDKLNLPKKTIVEVGSVWIGLIHGRRPRWQELPGILSNLLFANHYFWWGGFQRQVMKSFNDVDAIVFGHFHRPYIAEQNGILLFNPGAIYCATPAIVQARLARTRSFVQRVYLRRWFRSLPKIPTVGVLTVEDGKIRAEIIPISR